MRAFSLHSANSRHRVSSSCGANAKGSRNGGVVAFHWQSAAVGGGSAGADGKAPIGPGVVWLHLVALLACLVNSGTLCRCCLLRGGHFPTSRIIAICWFIRPRPSFGV